MYGFPLFDWHMRTCVVFGINVVTSFGFGASGRLARLLDLPIKPNKEISEKYPTLITPAAYTFSVWSLIFGLETAFVVWQCTAEHHWVMRVCRPFFFGSVFQSVWTLLFGSERVKASTFVSCLLVGAVYCCFSLSYWDAKPVLSPEYLLGCMPFGVHAAWVALATLVNFNIALVKNKVNISNQIKAAWASITVGMGIAMFFTGFTRDSVFTLTMAWGLAGVSNYDTPEALVKEAGIENVKNIKLYAKVASAACVGLGLLFILNVP